MHIYIYRNNLIRIEFNANGDNLFLQITQNEINIQILQREFLEKYFACSFYASSQKGQYYNIIVIVKMQTAKITYFASY